ncbi:MAG: hypothetical protein QME68_05790 [Elusimicrobiota bacterium]|nr:hypothetical protein [Elusimicrobiota bacterium]
MNVFFGYRFNVEDGIFNIGLSLNLQDFDLSYAYIPTRGLSPTHRISFGVRFGLALSA